MSLRLLRIWTLYQPGMSVENKFPDVPMSALLPDSAGCGGFALFAEMYAFQPVVRLRFLRRKSIAAEPPLSAAYTAIR